MKTLFTWIIAMLACSQLLAQHRIFLLDGSVFENVRLHEIKSQAVMYEQHGSLHDVLIREIESIWTESQIIHFDENGKATYSSRNNRSAKVYRRPEAPIPQNHQFLVFVTPTALAGLFTTYQGGIEYMISDRVSLQGEIGYISHGWFLEDFERSRVEGIGGRLHIRNYARKASQFLFLKGRSFLDLGGFQTEVNMQNTRETRIRVRGAYLRTGIQRIFANGLMIESFFGVGLNQRSFSNDPSSNWFVDLLRLNSDGILPGFTTGFKIGIALE